MNSSNVKWISRYDDEFDIENRQFDRASSSIVWRRKYLTRDNPPNSLILEDYLFRRTSRNTDGFNYYPTSYLLSGLEKIAARPRRSLFGIVTLHSMKFLSENIPIFLGYLSARRNLLERPFAHFGSFSSGKSRNREAADQCLAPSLQNCVSLSPIPSF